MLRDQEYRKLPLLQKKTNKEKKYYEDLFDGESLHCQTVHITKKSILSFAKEFDPQPFHINEQKGKESIFNGLVASSLHTLSACTRVVVDALGNIAILSGVGMDEVKMYNPVRPGDILLVDAWWTNLKKSESKPEYGYGIVKCNVKNKKNEVVIDYGYQYLIATHPKSKYQ
jgi:acyl dehydratase